MCKAFLATLVTVCFALSPACSKKDEDTEKPGAKEPEVSFDEAAVKATLQGTWHTGKNPDNPQSTYVIDGDKAEVTQHRMINSETGEPFVYRGALVVSGENEFGVKADSGETYGFHFVKIGDTMHISVGSVYRVPDLDAFQIDISVFEKIERSASGCKWIKEFGGDTESRDVECGLDEKDGKKVFTYQVPGRGDPDAFNDSYLYVVNGYLVSEQMMSEPARKE
jgi:hypothetical protein